jgi:hypothetical protein
MLRPPIPDKAGRGDLCRVIDQLTKEVVTARPDGPKPNKDELPRLLHRLDRARAKFHQLYRYTPKPHEDDHA